MGAESHDLAFVVGRVLEGRLGQDMALRRSRIGELVRLLPAYKDVTDRMVRGAIESLRDEGWMICNLGDDLGYYVASSPDEYQHFRRLYASYATTILGRIKEMDRTASNRWGAGALQERLF